MTLENKFVVYLQFYVVFNASKLIYFTGGYDKGLYLVAASRFVDYCGGV